MTLPLLERMTLTAKFMPFFIHHYLDLNIRTVQAVQCTSKNDVQDYFDPNLSKATCVLIMHVDNKLNK